MFLSRCRHGLTLALGDRVNLTVDFLTTVLALRYWLRDYMKIYNLSNAETGERKRILNGAGVVLSSREDAFSSRLG